MTSSPTRPSGPFVSSLVVALAPIGLLFAALFLLVSLVTGCTAGTIGEDGVPAGGPGAGSTPSDGGTIAGSDRGGSPTGGGGGATIPPVCSTPPGASCTVTADCPSPLVCVAGKCSGPDSSVITCEPDVPCPSGLVCIAAVCQTPPGTCVHNGDCPVGFVCTGGSCNVDGTGGCASDSACPSGQVCVGGACVKALTCKDLGSGPELSGTWQTISNLHLGEAVPGAVAAVLDVARVLRDILAGKEDFGLPSYIGVLVDSYLASVITTYVPPWGVSLIDALGDLADILSNIEVDSTMTLDDSAGAGGGVCSGSYRGSETWDYLSFTYKGSPVRARPADIPEIGAIHVEDFGARYVCGTLFIDRHRIDNVVTGIIKWIVDTVVYETSGYSTVDDALNNLVDCYGLSVAVDSDLACVCPSCPSVQALLDAGCTTALTKLESEIDMALAAPTTLDLLSIKGMAGVVDASHLSPGRWYGSLAGGDFTGDFTSQK